MPEQLGSAVSPTRHVHPSAISESAGQIGEVLKTEYRPGACSLLRFADGRELWFRERELQPAALADKGGRA